MYVVVAISTCHPKTNNKKSGDRGNLRKTRSRCNSFACEGMNQLDSATRMHDCVINNRKSSTSRPVKGGTRDKSDHVTRTRKPRVPHHEAQPFSPPNQYHESPTMGSNLESGEGMYGASCLRGEKSRGVSRRFIIMRATSCGMLTIAVLPGLTLAPSENV